MGWLVTLIKNSFIENVKMYRSNVVVVSRASSESVRWKDINYIVSPGDRCYGEK